MRMRRFWIGALIVPLALVLNACRVQTDFEILNADEFRYTYDLSIPADPEEVLTGEEICESLGQTEAERIDVQPYDDERIGCRWTMTLSIHETNEMITLADDVWTFQVTPEMLEDQRGQMEQLEGVIVTVRFPGEVISHNGSSTVDGTTVTWTDIDEIFGEEGLLATANDVDGGSPPGSILPTDPYTNLPTPTAEVTSPAEVEPTPTAQPTVTQTVPTANPEQTAIGGRDATQDGTGGHGMGIPWWVWVVGAAVAVMGITGFSLRGRNKKPGAASAAPAPVDPFEDDDLDAEPADSHEDTGDDDGADSSTGRGD